MPAPRVLVISYRFPPQNVGGCIRGIKFIKYLAQAGWHVDVMVPTGSTKHGFENDLVDSKINLIAVGCWRPFQQLQRFKSLLRSSGGASANQTATTDSAVNKSAKMQPGLLTRLLWWLQFPDEAKFWHWHLLPAIRRYHRQHPQCRKVFMHGPPFAHFLPVIRQLETLQMQLVVDFRDPWSQDDLFYYPFAGSRAAVKRLEAEILRSQNTFVTVTEPLQRQFEALVPQVVGRMHTITNGFDPDDIDTDAFLKTPTKFVLAHTGNSSGRPTELFFAGLAKFLERQPAAKDKVEVRFYGNRDNAVVAASRNAGLEALTQFVQHLPHQELFKQLPEVAVFLLFLSFLSYDPISSPGKVYEYMAMRRPILGFGGESVAGTFIHQYHYGRHFIGTPTADEVADEIDRLYRQWQAGKLIPFGDGTVLTVFSRKQLTHQLIELLKHD